VDLAIQVATDVLSNDETLLNSSTIPVVDIVDLLDFCFSTTNVNYNDTHYQQIFGTAMGSPVSAVMANLVMEHLENEHCPLPLYNRAFGNDMWMMCVRPLIPALCKPCSII